MYEWLVDFHMKNGDVIKTKVYSKYDNSHELLTQDDSGLMIKNVTPTMFNVYSSPDDSACIVIRLDEVSSMNITAAGGASVRPVNAFH